MRVVLSVPVLSGFEGVWEAVPGVEAERLSDRGATSIKSLDAVPTLALSLLYSPERPAEVVVVALSCAFGSEGEPGVKSSKVVRVGQREAVVCIWSKA